MKKFTDYLEAAQELLPIEEMKKPNWKERLESLQGFLVRLKSDSPHLFDNTVPSDMTEEEAAAFEKSKAEDEVMKKELLADIAKVENKIKAIEKKLSKKSK